MILRCSYLITALAICGTAADAAPVSISLKLDSYANTGTVAPLPWASVDFVVKDPTFSTHAGNDTIAGLLSGTSTTTNQRYYVFCSELNQDIGVGTNYGDFSLYSDYTDAPIQDGRPMGAGKALSKHDKRLVAGILQGLGVSGDIMGFVSPSGQDLIGIAVNNADAATLKAISNDQAAAAQIAIWTLVHGLDKGRDNIKLNSDTFTITRIGSQSVTPQFEQTFETTVTNSFAVVPEPSLLMAATAVMLPALATRPRRERRAIAC